MATVVTLLLSSSCVLLIFCISSQSQGQGCDDGWFGPRLDNNSQMCQYKCRCATAGKCTVDGQCTNGGCQGGWFGPACQYADLAYKAQNIITDGNDASCLTATASTTQEVELKYLTSSTWLRVRVSKSDFLHQLTVQFRGSVTLSCLNPRNASVDDTTLDIYCDLNELAQSVTLSGDGVKYLCSVYVSGGRNVALRQPTTQSSTYSENSITTGGKLETYSSNLSVDGNTSPDFYGSKSCSCTNPKEDFPNWNVSFPRPQNVQRYILYNRNELAARMTGFFLRSFDENNTLVFNYNDPPASQAQAVYTVFPPVTLTLPVSLVNIIANNSDKLLQMCEVEVYGDTACVKGKYGRECQYDCNCDGEGETCFISTGGCPSGCKTGFYGESCNLPCKPGTYGLRCHNNCSEFCVPKNMSNETSCDFVNGTCIDGCVSGYQGNKCDSECSPKHYGQGCVHLCSQFCLQNESNERSCDHVNGTCFSGCQNGYFGATCMSMCPKGSYGHECNSTCSPFCVAAIDVDKSQCNHVTGDCLLGCTGGFDPLFCKKEPKDDEEGEKTKVIIGAVVGSILGVILVALVIFAVIMFRRRYKKTKTRNETFSTENSINGSSANLSGAAISTSSVNFVKSKPEAKKSNGTKEGVKEAENKIYPGIYYNSQSSLSSTVVPLDGLEEFMASKNKEFFKNDHSRVNLISNKAKKHGDYINASYIDGYKSDERFIASQGPTKDIVEDFVRMLWEQQVEKVIMLTNLVEEGKQKCMRYWPEDGEIKVGEITVILTTTQVFADYTIRRLKLKKEEQSGQDLIHFHFTSWPDKDIPNTPWSLVDFEQRVASYPSSKPIVVHCSAGVGRTGTFIALRNVMRQAEETGSMDFFTTVQKLRRDRLNMVQTVDQYIFLHRAAQVAMLCIGTTVTSKDIQRRILELETKMSSGQAKMEKEFKSICSVCDVKEEEMTFEENPYSVYENSQAVVNKLKNRDNSILPRENNRAKLQCERSDLGDYINAVLVPSFSKQNQQVLTQLPLPATVADFWRLIIQYQISLIVAFDVDLGATDETIADYLSPSDGITSSLFKIKTEPASNTTNWKQQKLVVTTETSLGKFKNIKHKVTHLTSVSKALDKRTQLAFVQHIRSLQQEIGEGRTVYMCRNGATFCGLACVLSLLLDRMDNDQCQTVPLVVGAIKAIRPEIIPTLEQYKLLYDVLEFYSNTMNEYSNIGNSIS